MNGLNVDILIPQDILNDLKCDSCNHYLSCGPIYFQHDTGKTTCGRCNQVDDDTWEKVNMNTSMKVSNVDVKQSRNSKYETLAKLGLFPCKYAEYGCLERIKFSPNRVPFHELNCSFIQRSCPIQSLQKCKWRGRWADLLEHARAMHSSHVLRNQVSLEHDISKSMIETYLISTNSSELFLLRMEIVKEDNKILHSLYYLGDMTRVNHFIFDLIVERDENDHRIIKRGKILTDDSLNVLKHVSITNDIAGLASALEGDTDLTFTTLIRKAYMLCRFCRKAIFNQTSAGISLPALPTVPAGCCTACVSKLYYCKNKTQGCSFMDTVQKKLEKHETYFCKYTTKCYGTYFCKKTVAIGEMHVHLQSEHPDIFKFKFNMDVSGDKDRSNFFCIPKICLLESSLGPVVCKYVSMQEKIEIDIFTAASSDELQYMSFGMIVEETATQKMASFSSVITSKEVYDLRITVPVNDLPSTSIKDLDFKMICKQKRKSKYKRSWFEENALL